MILSVILNLFSCASKPRFEKTVSKLELSRFMGTWYVQGGRFTFLEKEVHNGVETYTWNQDKQLIEIGFTYNQGSFNGPQKSLPQKGYIHNTETNAHWKVSPLWPFKFDYLVIALADDYSWTVIGVPDQKYVWIMSKSKNMSEETFNSVLTQINSLGYDSTQLVKVPHN